MRRRVFYFKFLFILTETEKACTQGREGEGQGDRIPNGLCADSREPQVGL